LTLDANKAREAQREGKLSRDVGHASKKPFVLLSWNIASVNNNPFEYWADFGAEYKKMLDKTGKWIDEHGKNTVGSIFTDELYQQLKTEMVQSGGYEESDFQTKEAAPNDEKTKGPWDKLKNRTVVGQFLKAPKFETDEKTGKKTCCEDSLPLAGRAISLPDRLTNTIVSEGKEGKSLRPAVINGYEERDLSKTTGTEWLQLWSDYMFKEPGFGKKVGGRLKDEFSYHGIQEDEKGKYSRPLQLMYLAAFDWVTIQMMNDIQKEMRGPEEGKTAFSWWDERKKAYQVQCAEKPQRTVEVLERLLQDADADVGFVQEAGKAFVQEWGKKKSRSFSLLQPETLGKQSSVILVHNERFKKGVRIDITVPNLKPKQEGAVKQGLLAYQVEGMESPPKKYLLVSFHGDSDGLLTTPVVKGLSNWLNENKDVIPLFGMDANAHYENNDGKALGLEAFETSLEEAGLKSAFETASPTTLKFRTMVQAQPSKGKTYAQVEHALRVKKGAEPKDHVVVPQGWTLKSSEVLFINGQNEMKAFTGQEILPTLYFPSDHAAVKVVQAQRRL